MFRPSAWRNFFNRKGKSVLQSCETSLQFLHSRLLPGLNFESSFDCYDQQKQYRFPCYKPIVYMAGHSKWHNIRFRKSRQDAMKNNVFTKIGNEITTAVRSGGGNVPHNQSLTLALEKARKANVPKSNIQAAIDKGLGKTDEIMEQVVYEGMGPSGTAYIVECLTGNRKRMAPLIRHIFSKHGGEMKPFGSLQTLFQKKGRVVVECKDKDLEPILMLAVESGAEDLNGLEDIQSLEILCSGLKETMFMRQQILDKGYKVTDTEVFFHPNMTVDVDEEIEEQVQKIVDELENLDEVQNVYHNAQFKDENADPLTNIKEI